MTLSEIASLATIIAALAVVGTAVIYHGQLRAMTKATQMQSLLVIMKYVEDLDLRRARYFMFEHGETLRQLGDLELTRFRGHLRMEGGVHDGKTKTVFRGVAG